MTTGTPDDSVSAGSWLGRAFVLLRELRGLTQYVLGRRAGVKPDAVKEIETGSRRPRPATRARLLFALRASPLALEVAGGLLRFLARGAAGAADLRVARHRAARRWGESEGSVADLWSRAAHPRRSGPAPASAAVAPAGVRARAEVLLERLQRHPPEGRRALVQESREFRGWALSERLCAESAEASPRCGVEALEWAELALIAARRAPDAPGWCPELEADAWAHVGNARRVCGDLLAADAAFREAKNLRMQRCSPSPLDKARALDLEASLRRAQRHLREAHELLDRAEALARGDRARSRILILRGKTLEEERKYDEAVECLLGARALVEAAGDQRLRWVLLLNLSDYFTNLGQHAEAEALLPEVRGLTRALGNPLDQLRLLWVKGRIFAGTGRPDEAIEALRQVRREFLDRGIAYDAALVTLELAIVLLEQGRQNGEVLELADEVAGVCKAQGVARETLAAIEVFLEAAKREAVTLDLARQILEEVRRVGR
jgi:tetratricopeptide (TPR) repeat protein/DNA-binding XRE family transcriptional regulator